MPASQLFAADGHVIPNMATREYRIRFDAECEHGKIRSAEIVITAPSQLDAMEYANTWLRQGVMRRTVVTAITAL